MSVAYEPRSFIHEGTYPPLDDEPDHATDQRFTDSEVAEQLSHFATEAAIIPDERGAIVDERDMLAEDDHVMNDTTQLDLDVSGFSSPLQVTLHVPTLPDPIPEMKEPSPEAASPPPLRGKAVAKPERVVHKSADGKYHCTRADCREEVRAFSRKCEWNKHMDKHERPYRCPAKGCEPMSGFTYSGGLLRHEREVHGKHGGPKNTVNCPHTNCKRHTGKGFSRQENLNEHLRRVHTNIDASTPPTEPIVSSPNDSEKSGVKRKRGSSSEPEIVELREEIKRVREENEKLKAEMEQQSISLMAQVAHLQEALRHAIGTPTAHML